MEDGSVAIDSDSQAVARFLTTMKLAPEQRWKVAKALVIPRYIAELSSPEELHAFMLMWNWDCGTAEPKTILEHPACDKGTALSIYFLGGAGYYQQFSALNEVPRYHLEGYNLIVKAREVLKSDGFASACMSFDPTPYLNDYDDVPKCWEHPEAVKVAIEGNEIELDFDYYDHSEIIDGFCNGLINAADLLEADVCTHDCDDDAVYLSIEKNGFSSIVEFRNFDWNNAPNSDIVTFSAEMFWLWQTEVDSFSDVCQQKYAATGNSIEDAIADIIEQWESDYLKLLQNLTQTSSYTKLDYRSNEGANVYCSIWSITEQKVYFDSKLVKFAESAFKSQANMTPCLIKLLPDRAELQLNSSSEPVKLDKCPAIAVPSYIFIVFQET